MYLRVTLSVVTATFAFSAVCSGQAQFQVAYASNLTSDDSIISITNTGANGAPLLGPGFGGAVGNLCSNLYLFSADEQLITCCSILLTPSGLARLSVNTMLTTTLTGV